MNIKTLIASSPKINVLGTPVNRTSYQESTKLIIHSARLSKTFTVAAVNVHSLVTGYLQPKKHGYYLSRSTFVVPDGQPVRWALNLLRQPGEMFLTEPVRGPELMLRVCEKAAEEGISIFLYGSTESVLADLQCNLQRKYPNLVIAGAVSPPFRALTPAEDSAYIQQIRQSGADIVFVGLGCPSQEKWMTEHGNELSCPILSVGAAFDIHAGKVKEAPLWVQSLCLEWMFRLIQEPTRLWKRYLIYNPLYLIFLLLQLLNLLPSPTSVKPKAYQESVKLQAQHLEVGKVESVS